MASAAQIRANRENAKRSTGPRTEAGKQTTKFNALIHGLAAESLVIRGEDPAKLDALRAQLQAEHCPVGQTEAMLVEEIAQCWWRLQRARAQEKRSIEVTYHFKPFNPDDLAHVTRYVAHVERGWHRAITQLRAVQGDRRKREAFQTEPITPTTAATAQPEESEKVMAVGSVPYSEPQPSQPSRPASELTDDELRQSPEFKQFQHDRFMKDVVAQRDPEVYAAYQRRTGQR